MDPFTAFSMVAAGAQGLAGRAAAMDESARAEAQAVLADTQALQRDTLARDDLTRTLDGIRAARAANGLSVNSPNAWVIEQETSQMADRDRQIQLADDRQRAANYRSAAKSARRAGQWSLVTGIAKAGIPLAEYGSNKGWF
ncbi:MAG: hypothetical protein JXQ91_07725 [Vannielia sp.]|uniref:hypothetical protein n=1 Tax=Vannielia sp. TaxID=2813045 RepID=UPI003B8DA1DC